MKLYDYRFFYFYLFLFYSQVAKINVAIVPAKFTAARMFSNLKKEYPPSKSMNRNRNQTEHGCCTFCCVCYGWVDPFYLFLLSNSVVFTNDCAVAAGLTAVPIFGRFDFFKPVELTDFLETLIYKLPGTLAIGVNFTAVFARTAAWTV